MTGRAGSLSGLFLVAALCAAPCSARFAAAAPGVTVGSKAFPESWILGEALTRVARQATTVSGRETSLEDKSIWS